MSTDISEFLHTELFTPSTTSSSSRESSPSSPGTSSNWSMNLLSTPPEPMLGSSFPEINYADSNSLNLFHFLEDDISMKPPLSTSNVASTSDLFGGGFDFGIDLASYTGDLSSSITPFSPASIASTSSPSTIDPQLVDTPSVQKEEETDEEKEKEKNTLTLKINPVKVGGHGKARKGTVQSGGITKKATSVPPVAPIPQVAPLPGPLATSPVHKENQAFKEELQDDIPEDWRPPPEVLAKMTSKEKRQLRNKISARNFRNRRKEYISTLELDIAERDRLLQAIRSELGSTQSENLALRQEIAALKKALLEGRTPSGATLTAEDISSLNLPPPGPLPPAPSAAITQTNTTSSTNLVTANTQKDIPISPRLGTGAFWGGLSSAGSLFGGAGGITPVHTVFVPELSTLARNVNLNTPQSARRPGLGENLNPRPGLNNFGPGGKQGGLDGFMDSNPFSMKTLDRIQPWTRMSQQEPHPSSSAFTYSSPRSQTSRSPSPPPPLMPSPSMSTKPLPGGSSSSLRPAFFASSSKTNIPIASSSKSSPKMHTRSFNVPTEKEKETAYMAALASQTLFRKLGGAFWDAFTSASPSMVDTDKVLRVLEGKAVLRVVDVDPVARSLEEGMRNLSLTKRA